MFNIGQFSELCLQKFSRFLKSSQELSFTEAGVESLLGHVQVLVRAAQANVDGWILEE
jgi:hypothetical protein